MWHTASAGLHEVLMINPLLIIKEVQLSIKEPAENVHASTQHM